MAVLVRDHVARKVVWLQGRGEYVGEGGDSQLDLAGRIRESEREREGESVRKVLLP